MSTDTPAKLDWSFNIDNIDNLILTNQDVVKERLATSSFVGIDVCKIRTRRGARIFLFSPDFQMTRKGIITIIVSVIVGMLTPAGMYVFIVPFLVGCIGGKKVRKFYFNYFFKEECK